MAETWKNWNLLAGGGRAVQIKNAPAVRPSAGGPEPWRQVID